MSYSVLNDLKEQISEDELVQLTDDGIHIEDAVFSGSGLDDLTSGGIFSGSVNRSFLIEIDAEGTPDTFKWSKDGGTTWDVSTIAITGAAQDLIEGVTIIFLATTGHTLGDQWAFDAFPVGTIDTSVTDRAIDDADAEIDGYCAERYTVPFDPVPTVIRKYSVDIAIYNLFSRRHGPDEVRTKRYDDAIIFLKNVADGDISLGADAPKETSQDSVGVTTDKDDRIFTSTTLANY